MGWIMDEQEQCEATERLEGETMAELGPITAKASGEMRCNEATGFAFDVGGADPLGALLARWGGVGGPGQRGRVEFRLWIETEEETNATATIGGAFSAESPSVRSGKSAAAAAKK
ncbi:MAG: hypothetical protein ABIL09_02365 [Gemmatimonadota bacterium]